MIEDEVAIAVKQRSAGATFTSELARVTMYGRSRAWNIRLAPERTARPNPALISLGRETSSARRIACHELFA